MQERAGGGIARSSRPRSGDRSPTVRSHPVFGSPQPWPPAGAQARVGGLLPRARPAEGATPHPERPPLGSDRHALVTLRTVRSGRVRGLSPLSRVRACVKCAPGASRAGSRFLSWRDAQRHRASDVAVGLRPGHVLERRRHCSLVERRADLGGIEQRERPLDVPRVAIDAGRDQRVVHVADGQDPRLEVYRGRSRRCSPLRIPRRRAARGGRARAGARRCQKPPRLGEQLVAPRRVAADHRELGRRPARRASGGSRRERRACPCRAGGRRGRVSAGARARARAARRPARPAAPRGGCAPRCSRPCRRGTHHAGARTRGTEERLLLGDELGRRGSRRRAGTTGRRGAGRARPAP